MKTITGKFSAVKHSVLAAALALAAQGPAHAQGMPEGHDGPGMEGHGLMHPGMPGFDAPFGHMPGPRLLHGLQLSEEQQDKIFAIQHAQQPQLREQMKTVRKAQEALHAMRFSAQYDYSKAKALTDLSARAMADSALLRLRGEQQIYALLTAEQRKQLEEMRDGFKAHAGRDPRKGMEPPKQAK